MLIALTANAQNKQYEESISTKTGLMKVHYFNNPPAAYEENGQMKGIEIDVLEQFQIWLKKTKGITLNYEYKAFDDFGALYESVKALDGNLMGIGTIVITKEREGEVDFSAPYMKNVSVMVSSGNIKTARTEEELKTLLQDLQAYTVKESIHQDHLMDLYSKYGVAPRIKYLKNPVEVLEKIKESPRNFGYVDVITFWKYLKTSDQYVKMHSIANVRDENFGFIFPKNSGWANEFNEFFESGFGFTATKEYHKILEKHLSYEVLNSVELNP